MLALAAVAVAVNLCLPIPECGDEGGPWLLVYRYSFVEDDGTRITRETFDGRRFQTEENARRCARILRQTGVDLPTLARYGRDSNVMPESITPMLSLLDQK